MNRAGVYLLCAGVTLAMLSPILRRPPVDGFPLSTYPMFASPRGPMSEIYTVLGVTAQGEREVLSPTLISGDPWPNLAVETTKQAARSKTRRKQLCEAVAARVADDRRRARRYVELEFVKEVYDVREYFAGETEPNRRKVLARCPVAQ